MFKRVVESHQEESFGGIEAARQYAEQAEKATIRYRGFMAELKTLGIKGRYLEVGAGSGTLAVRIAQANPDVQITGVDLSPDMVSIAKEYVESKGLEDRIQFVVGDAEDEGLINSLGKFDLIYNTFTLHHWEEPEKVIGVLSPALADGGVLYLYDLMRVWWLHWIPIHNGFLNSIRAAYLPDEVRAMLQALNIDQFEIKWRFPFMQSIIARK